MSDTVKAAIVGGVCAIVAALISYSAVTKSKEAEIAQLIVKNDQIQIENKQLIAINERLKADVSKKNSEIDGLNNDISGCQGRLKKLIASVESLNNSTFIQWYGTNDSWTGFGDRGKKGAHMMQCCAGRFVEEWGRQFSSMNEAGCNIRNPIPVVVEHGDHCDLRPK